MKTVKGISFFKKLILILSVPALVAAVTAVNYAGTKKTCKAIQIQIINGDKLAFVTTDEIKRDYVEGLQISEGATLVKDINTKSIEQKLLQNKWISSAEVYFNGAELNILVKQKEPIARVIQNEVNSYYVDSFGLSIPVHPSFSADVPLFTTPPLFEDKKSRTIKHDLVTVAKFVHADTFWNSMLAQIDVNKAGEFEAIPVMGKQSIFLGNSDQIADKFNRLLKFYQDVMPTVGWDYYSSISVKFNKQVVAQFGDTASKKHNAEPKLFVPVPTASVSLNTEPNVTAGVVTAKPQPTAPIQTTAKLAEKPTNKQIAKPAIVTKAGDKPAPKPSAQTTYTVNKKPEAATTLKPLSTKVQTAKGKVAEKPQSNKVSAKPQETATKKSNPKPINNQSIKDEYQ